MSKKKKEVVYIMLGWKEGVWCCAAECDVEVCEAKAGRKVRWWRVLGHGRWSEEVDEVGRERWW